MNIGLYVIDSLWMDRLRRESSSEIKSLRVRSGRMNKIPSGFATIIYVATFLLGENYQTPINIIIISIDLT